MANYRFKGDPSAYQWDFILEKDKEYPGDTVAFHRHTIEELVQYSSENEDTFHEEWEEVGNG